MTQDGLLSQGKLRITRFCDTKTAFHYKYRATYPSAVYNQRKQVGVVKWKQLRRRSFKDGRLKDIFQREKQKFADITSYVFRSLLQFFAFLFLQEHSWANAEIQSFGLQAFCFFALTQTVITVRAVLHVRFLVWR